MFFEIRVVVWKQFFYADFEAVARFQNFYRRRRAHAAERAEKFPRERPVFADLPLHRMFPRAVVQAHRRGERAVAVENVSGKRFGDFSTHKPEKSKPFPRVPARKIRSRAREQAERARFRNRSRRKRDVGDLCFNACAATQRGSVNRIEDDAVGSIRRRFAEILQCEGIGLAFFQNIFGEISTVADILLRFLCKT